MPVLEVEHVSKHFSGVYVLKDLSLEIYPGKVTAVTGENGAGKSTLMKIIAGVYTDFEGRILYNDEEMHFSGPGGAAERGIVIIHQELNLIPGLSVAENIFLGREPVNRLGLIDYRKMHEDSAKLLTMLQLEIDPALRVDRLKVGEQQLVEIARALLFDSKVLIMDEPTSAISDHETELLFRIIRDLKSKGVAILYISHKLDELFTIADNYVVLRDGELIGTGMMKDTDKEGIIRMMVGRKLESSYRSRGKDTATELMRVENLKLKSSLTAGKLLVNEVNFTLHQGEILGIAGLMGAGRTEILESLFGMHPRQVSGKIFIRGEEKEIRSVGDAIREGLALVPEDRKLMGLILGMNVRENTSLASLGKVSSWQFIKRGKEAELSREFTGKMNIRVAGSDMEVEKLSGGNQQKVVLSKWLATKPGILLLDEPTRGIDVGTKIEIYRLIGELADEGLGIIIVSSELPEILAVSDRILVMSESRQTAILSRDEATEEKIMHAALTEKQN